jgi:hypothetical protein
MTEEFASVGRLAFNGIGDLSAEGFLMESWPDCWITHGIWAYTLWVVVKWHSKLSSDN